MENNPTNNKSKHWCKRMGKMRVCLTCGREVKANPNGCSCSQHQESYRKKLVRQHAYWDKHKKQLVETNRRYRAEHPEQQVKASAYQKKWYQQNREKKLAKGRDWEERNKEKRRCYQQQWHAAHRQKSRESCRRYYAKNRTKKNLLRGRQLKAARAKNPGIRMRLNLRTRLANCIRERGGTKTFSIRGKVLLYTSEQLRLHIETLFTPDMNWDNYGTVWEIDHIKRCEQFDLTVLEQAIECFALSNLRPLDLGTNRSRYHTEKREAIEKESTGDVSTEIKEQSPNKPATPGQLDLPM